MKAKAKRLVYRIVYDFRLDCWICRSDSASSIRAEPGGTKRDLETAARAFLRRRWRERGKLGQLFCHSAGPGSRIQWEATYGKDPKQRKG